MFHVNSGMTAHFSSCSFFARRLVPILQIARTKQLRIAAVCHSYR